MDTVKIKQIGYFDRVCIKGELKNISSTDGIEIGNNKNLSEYNCSSKELPKITINILGQSTDIADNDEVARIREDRYKSGIKLVSKDNNTENYIIALADIFILKGKEIENYTHDKVDLENYVTATKLAHEIASKNKEEVGNINVAIVDRVYTYSVFRNCGVSSWIHNNLIDIIKLYGLTDVNGIVLTYGDFTKQELKQSNYLEFLKDHYKSKGYNELNSYRKIRYHVFSKSIMYKIL